VYVGPSASDAAVAALDADDESGAVSSLDPAELN
jgi:hypothetical protein